MSTYAELAEALGSRGAPPAVQALAQLFDLQAPNREVDAAADLYLSIAELASQVGGRSLKLLPEIEVLLALDRQLPASFGVPRPQRAAAAAEAVAGSTEMVTRSFEAATPLLSARASFAEAATLADDRSQWAIGAPQMTIDRPPPLLSPNGWLWRGRLTKTTELLKPIRAPLETRETIEITAEGRDHAGGSGFRRYSHFLVESEDGPGRLKLLEDSGWIELRGGPTYVVLRLYKRVKVLLPRAMDEKFGAALPLGLSVLLWMWAEGLLKAIDQTTPTQKEIQAPPASKRPIEPKRAEPAPGSSEVRVAVLGGGLAGLACAWLLSNPQMGGKPAWSPPDETPTLAVKVSLLEKCASLGGKAASRRRRATPGDERIEEHGLHVLMGCYKNLLRILEQVGATGKLGKLRGTLIPMGAPGDLADSVTVDLEPWVRRDGRESLAAWMTDLPDDERLDLSYLRLSFSLEELWRLKATDDLLSLRGALRTLGLAVVEPRPLLRMTLRLWQRVANTLPATQGRWDAAALLSLSTQVLLKRIATAELVMAADAALHPFKAADSAMALRRTPPLLVPLASQLRALVRVALPPDSPNADVRLANEFIELGCTVAIGLADDAVFPNWAIGRPDDPLSDDYTNWARAMHGTLDELSLADWLVKHGVASGFAARSRVLAAVTAGLFTTPDRIAAGTFVHGLARFLFTYEDAPYRTLLGGTGEAVVDSIADALLAAKVALQTECTVTGIVGADAGAAATAVLFKHRNVDAAPLEVDAIVVAMPPFQRALAGLGLPETLTTGLDSIEHSATVSVQHWTDQAPRFPEVIVSGLGSPMRCAAAMDHLKGQEGSVVKQAPVYYCGDVDDIEAEIWRANADAEGAKWLAEHASSFQSGTEIPESHARVNLDGSERYVSADCATQAARPDVFTTGVPNLWLAGDWTRSCFACGSIEGAVTSGLEAARHLLVQLGCTVHLPIVGSMFDEDR